MDLPFLCIKKYQNLAKTSVYNKYINKKLI